MANRIDVHVFDGKLDDVLLIHRSQLEEISKIERLIKVQDILYSPYKFSAKASGVINKICQSTDTNVETTNSLNALDVLHLILTLELEDDFVKNLEEQLEDVVGEQGGSCPAGRTTRIMQLFIQYHDSKNMCIRDDDHII